MEVYKEMYMILCKAIDEAIAPLEQVPSARPQAQILRQALLEAEELYVMGGDL